MQRRCALAHTSCPFISIMVLKSGREICWCKSKGLTIYPAYGGREGRVRLDVADLSPLFHGKGKGQDADEDEDCDEGTDGDENEGVIDARCRCGHGLPNVDFDPFCHEARFGEDADKGPCEGELLDVLGTLLIDGEDLDGDD